MKTIQIRNVPDEVHRELKARAALEGRSLSEWALYELRTSLSKPTMREWLERLSTREPVDLPEGAAAVIQASREERDRELFGD